MCDVGYWIENVLFITFDVGDMMLDLAITRWKMFGGWLNYFL